MNKERNQCRVEVRCKRQEGKNLDKVKRNNCKNLQLQCIRIKNKVKHFLEILTGKNCNNIEDYKKYQELSVPDTTATTRPVTNNHYTKQTSSKTQEATPQ